MLVGAAWVPLDSPIADLNIERVKIGIKVLAIPALCHIQVQTPDEPMKRTADLFGEVGK